MLSYSSLVYRNKEPIIDKKNLTLETKIYKDHKKNKNWNSFDDYSDSITRFWQISFIENKDELLTKSSCICSRFQKNYICKHLVLQAVRANYIAIPLSARTNEFSDLPKRGRPPTCSKALQLDAPTRKRKPSATLIANKKSKK
jgi:hypothetical protein